MSILTERFLAQFADFAEFAEGQKRALDASSAAKSQEALGVEAPCTRERGKKETQREDARASGHANANPANPANSDALADVIAYFNNASRGPCIRCGQPVTRLGDTHGFRNAFGDLVHLRCPGR